MNLAHLCKFLHPFYVLLLLIFTTKFAVSKTAISEKKKCFATESQAYMA